MKLIVLSGGTGTPKLLVGLKEVLDPSDLTVVANTADDIWISGNLVSPDLDSIIYTLAGMIDQSKWWGIKGDTFYTSKFLKSLGHEEVLALGDLDRSVHIFRSDLIRTGSSLSQTAEKICQALNVKQKVVPMTDDIVSTIITTQIGEIHLQNYWVGHGGKPQVRAIRFQGIEEAKPSQGFLDALSGDEPVIIGPSNPVTSIRPILALKRVRDLMSKKKVIAISPLIKNRPVSGPASKFMQVMGVPVTDQGVADLLGCVDLMVVGPESDYSGPCVKLNTFMKRKEDSLRLANEILGLI
ncbi:MAG: 2-phospho-L-lactate transferase [Methanotrichaceae archaeon]